MLAGLAFGLESGTDFTAGVSGVILVHNVAERGLFERFPEIRNQLWKGELWNHSYYVETIGSVSEENIRRYIEHQSKSY